MNYFRSKLCRKMEAEGKYKGSDDYNYISKYKRCSYNGCFFLSTRAELHHDESRDTKTDISIPT
jgi:hypothetical protein